MKLVNARKKKMLLDFSEVTSVLSSFVTVSWCGICGAAGRRADGGSYTDGGALH